MHYTVQKKGWFDERVMLEWVNNVLAPYIVTAPPDVIPLLLLDSFKVHLKGTITDAIQALGVEIEFIPAGCTDLVQPVDVGFNKPFKTYMTHLYSDFMMAQDPNMPIREATHREVSAWVKESVARISEETVINSWRKTGFSYFHAPDNNVAADADVHEIQAKIEANHEDDSFGSDITNNINDGEIMDDEFGSM
jgi:hypothetical protein